MVYPTGTVQSNHMSPEPQDGSNKTSTTIFSEFSEDFPRADVPSIMKLTHDYL